MPEDHAEPPRKRRRTSQQSKTNDKLEPLPKNATITKRPLHRPPLPSPYASSTHQKTIYVSTKTPFMSIIKRAEKLLHLADRRLVQSATTQVQHPQSTASASRQRKAGSVRSISNRADSIAAIAEEVETLKSDARRTVSAGGAGKEGVAGEDVVVKGTGRAMGKVLEVGGWFGQRAETYVVRVQTGTVGSIDDVVWEEKADDGGEEGGGGAEEGDGNMMDEEGVGDGGGEGGTVMMEKTRVRKLSVLEVYISLR